MFLIPLVNAYELNNDNYKMDIGIVTGNNLSNENYELDVNAYPIQSELVGNGYKLNFGYLANWIVEAVTPEVPSGPGGGGSAHQVDISDGAILSTPYYDVMIEGVKANYNVESIISFNITLINKGDVPDRDAILTYYLLSPTTIKIGESREIFEEIPPTCPNATYNRYEDICKYKNESVFEPLKTVLEREIALPLDTTKGQWKVYAEYETEIQPLIEVYKAFRVGPMRLSFMALVGILLLIYFIKSNNSKKGKYLNIKEVE